MSYEGGCLSVEISSFLHSTYILPFGCLNSIETRQEGSLNIIYHLLSIPYSPTYGFNIILPTIIFQPTYLPTQSYSRPDKDAIITHHRSSSLQGGHHRRSAFRHS